MHSALSFRRLVLIAAAASLTLLSASLRADPTTQTISLTDFDSYTNWTQAVLGTVALPTDTRSILSMTSEITIADQGWGNQSLGNGVYVHLYDNSVDSWAHLIAGASHSADTYSPQYSVVDFSLDSTGLATVDGILKGIDWSSSPNVHLDVVAQPYGYPGWELHTRNGSFSVTSSTVGVPDSGATAALLGLGLLGVAGLGRRLVRA